MEELEELKTLDQALKVEKCSRFQPRSHLKTFLNKDTLKDTLKVVGCQALPDEDHHVVCTSEGLYLLHQNVPKDAYLFDGCCYAYLYADLNTFASNGLPFHVTFMDNGSVAFFGVEDESFRKYMSYDIPSKLLDNRTGFTSAASRRAIYISLDCQSILDVEDLTKIFKLDMGELLSFFFMDGDKLLFYLYRHRVMGDLWFGIADQATIERPTDSFSDDWAHHVTERDLYRDERFATISKFQLRTSDQADCYIRKLDDIYAVAVTSRFTYIFKTKYPPIIVKNCGGLNLSGSVNISGSISSDKSEIRYKIELCVFDSSGIMSTASIELVPEPPRAVKWVQAPLLAGQAFEPGELNFITRLSPGLSTRKFESYFSVSDLTGLSLVDKKRNSVSVILPGSSKRVFDGNCIPTLGSDYDSYLFCGSFTETHGFVEKQTLLYPNDCFKIISEQQLLHRPVVDLWNTDKGLLYESIGALYSADTNEKICNFERSIWYTRHNVPVHEFDERTLSVSEAAIASEGTVCCLSVISAHGVLKVLDVRSCEHSELILSINLGSNIIRNAKSAVFYCASDSHYYTVCYHTRGCLSLYRDSSALGQINIELDWFVFDILLKSVRNVIYVITTSMDGRARVFNMFNGECLLELSSASETKLQLLNLGVESQFVLFYNEHECILTHLDGMNYGKLELGFRPLKIVPSSVDMADSVFYALDDQWSLKVVKFPLSHNSRFDASSIIQGGDVFDLPGCVPLRLLPFSKPSLAAIAIKDKKEGVLSTILFDYNNMCIVDKHDFDAKSCDFSNVLLQNFDHEIIPSEPLRLFMSRFFLVCRTKQDESFVHIFRISRYRLELLQTERLPCFVLSISLIQAGTRILFGGTQTITYELKPDFKNRTVVICHETHIEEPISKHLRAPLFYSCRDNWGTAISLIGDICQVQFPVGKQKECLIDTHDKLHRLGRHPLVKVATKRVPIHRQFAPCPTISGETVSYMSSESIIQSLSGPDRARPDDYYWVTVDCSDFVNLYKGSTNKPEGQYHLKSRILNVSPILSQSRGSRLGGFESTMRNTLPLFMITCEDGHIYTLSASDESKVGLNSLKPPYDVTDNRTITG